MRVLVVEDDPKMRALLVQGLREEGHAVESAGDGEMALARSTTSAYDAIVLDIMLPRRDGFSVLQELRRRGVATPVLVLTARSGIDDRVTGLDLGADDYLAKPFALQELLARLRAVTRRPATDRPGKLRLLDLEMDPDGHVASRAGRPLALTAKELQLLEYLLRNKGLVVTRAMILDAVWNLEDDGGSSLVAVYINYLRHKVDEPFDVKLIHTVRGVGYVMREEP
jgi:DNA-binding response OmpR family regulator